MGIDDHDTFTGLTQLQAAAADGNVDKVVELLDGLVRFRLFKVYEKLQLILKNSCC